jgi:hypothetical protein
MRRMAAAIMAALVLGGCTKQDIAQCGAKVDRIFRMDGEAWKYGPKAHHVAECMRAKGYEPRLDLESCDARPGGNYAMQPGCYTAPNWLARFLGRVS